MQVLEKFKLHQFEKSIAKAYPNLDRIAGAMIRHGAVEPLNAMTMSGINKATGIARSQLDGLIRDRPGFVRVHSLHASTVRFYYNPEFMRKAKNEGTNYPIDVLPLYQIEDAKVAEVVISELGVSSKNCDPEVVNEQGPHGNTRHVDYGIINTKDEMEAMAAVISGGIEGRVADALLARNGKMLDNAIVALLSLRETLNHHADNIEFWLG